MTKEEIKLIKDQQKAIKEQYEARLRVSHDLTQLQAVRMDEMSQRIDELNQIIKDKDDQIVHLQAGMTGEEIEYYGGI